MIYQIAYFSTATKHFTEQDLKDLLQVSQKNNKKLGITGVLLFIEGCFLQVLEGEKSTVEQVYDKVKKDTRHEGVIILFKGTKENRSFEEWSMGFKDLPFVEYKNQVGFSDISNEEFLNNIIKKRDSRLSRTLEIFYTGGL